MRIGKFEFTPRLLPTLLTFMLLPVLISLGIWQLGRADEKREILAERAKMAALPALEVSEQSRDAIADVEYRQLKVVGRFDRQYRIFIDNKVQQGRVGYQVVEPLVYDGGKSAVLVNRGWVAATASRSNLPAVPELTEAQTIFGIAKTNTRDVASLGSGNRSGESWPALVRWVDIGELQKSIPYRLKPYMLLQNNDNQDGLVREWIFVSSPPEKNQSYALQWFSLAIALLLIYLVVNTKRVNRQEDSNE